MTTARRIGLISDTHGLMRPQALAALQGVDEIWHAGDIGAPDVLLSLQSIAPVQAIRGNNDTAPWAQALPESLLAEIAGLRMLMIHDLKALRPFPDAADVQVILAGHSHRPSVTTQDGILLVNPGSAGPRRFRLPISVGMLAVQERKAVADIVLLDG